MTIYKNRAEAGKQLTEKLSHYANQPDVLVLGLPRGGVPVAYQIANALNVPMDVFMVRKLGLPGQEELAMGAVASGGIRVLNEEVVNKLNIPDDIISTATSREREELRRREQAYRDDRPAPHIANQTVILVDDGLATGTTMQAAIKAVKSQQPAKVVVAVPTAAPQTCRAIEREVDEIHCLSTPEPFLGVGNWYEEFPQVSDAAVREILKEEPELVPAAH